MSFQIARVVRFPGGVKFGPGDEQELESMLTPEMRKRFVSNGTIVMDSKKKKVKAVDTSSDEDTDSEAPKKVKKGKQAE